MEDRDLLRQFVQHNSQDAFRELVARHTDWLYCVCLRRLHDPALAEDATQAIFLALARHAPRLLHSKTLSPWLHQAAKFVTSNLQRARSRRARHESEAASMLQPPTQSTDDAWHTIEGDLEPALDRLAARDREVILLRFYERKTHEQIAAVLKISPVAAQKRLSRAVERLRGALLKAQVDKAGSHAALSVVLLQSTLQSHVVGSVPQGLAATGGALSSTTGSLHLTQLADGILRMTTLIKVKLALVAAAVGLMVAIPASLIVLRNREQAPEPIASPLPPGAFDPAAFNELSDWDRLQFVLGKLKERDKQLENLAFKVDDELMNPNPDGTWIVMRKSPYEMRRLGSSLWMHEQTGQWGSIGGLSGDLMYAWNGKEGFTMPFVMTDGSFTRVLVNPTEPPQLTGMTFNRAIGIRIRDGRSSAANGFDFSGPLPAHFEWMMKQESPFTVTLEPDQQTIKLEFRVKTLGRSVQTIWVSTDKGYMASKMEDRLLGGGESFASSLFTVQATEQVAGIWLPQKVLQQNSLGGPTTQRASQSHMFVAHDFKIGALTSGDVEVDIPVNCDIVDSIRKIHYTMNPDGTFNLLEFSESGPLQMGPDGRPFQPVDLYIPPAEARVNRIDDSTAALYTKTTEKR